MKFWKDLKKFSSPRSRAFRKTRSRSTNGWKNRYDTIVITNRVYDDLSDRLKGWVAQKDGNLVLLDKAVGMLPKMNLVDGPVGVTNEYAGYINFETAAEEPGGTYDHPSGLAEDVNKPGSAEGGQAETDELDDVENHRHQTYEPVPLGIAIENPNASDAFNSPVWYRRGQRGRASWR